MKQLVILSGKGGTGKTSLAAAFAHLAGNGSGPAPCILVDADVDAANLELLLEPHMLERQDFQGGKIARIETELCSQCGACAAICRFDAIRELEGGYQIDAVACEGCAACYYQCPNQAIWMQSEIAGEWYISDSRYGPLFHARLYPGQENSGKLVAVIKRFAQELAKAEAEQFTLLLVDGPPGIGCPVIAACSGADLALIVIEPTRSGLHDLERILGTTRHFKLPACVALNKADLSPALAGEILARCQSLQVPVTGRIPFDITISQAMTNGQPVTSFAPFSPSGRALRATWDNVLSLLYQDQPQ